MSRLKKLEKIAFDESLKTGDTKQFFGCLILKNKRIISKGHNFRSFDQVSCCCHAEMDAMYRHLSQIGQWRDFYRILKQSYRYTGVLSRSVGEIYSLIHPCLEKFPQGKKQKYKMYVFRFFTSGQCCNAKPCAECTRWMWIARRLGVQYDIYYTTEEEQLSQFKGDSNGYSPVTTYF